MSTKIVALAGLVVFAALGAKAQEVGVSADKIVFGRSTNNTGASPSGYIERGKALAAVFKRINGEGGVNGRKIELVELDDGYEPARTVENTKKLVEETKVFGLIGYAGTPTCKAVMPYVTSNKIPFLPITAAEFLRQPVSPTIFNVRAGYLEETETAVKHVVQQKKIKDLGVLYQDDAFGTEGLSGLQRYLVDTDAKIRVKVSYKRNVKEIDEQAKEILKEKPAALFVYAQTKQAASLLKLLAKEIQGGKWKPTIVVSSNVTTSEFFDDAGKASELALYPQSLPLSDDASLKVVRDYQRDLRASGVDDFSGIGFEAYISGLIAAEGLKRAGKEPTRESFVKALETIRNFDLGGLKVSFSENDHQATHDVWLATVKDGKLVKLKK